MRARFGVAGVGLALAPTVLTNAQLEDRMDTTDAWIRERTGIIERRTGGTTASLAVEAARDALAAAGEVTNLAAIIVATSTADEAVPSVASRVADDLGSTAATFDLNGACAGFVYALAAATPFLDSGAAVLLVGSDAMTRITDPDDRATAILFGDGAGAMVVVGDSGTDGGLLGFDAGTQPASHDLLYCPLGGTIQMQGQAVFRLAVRAAVDSAVAALDDAGLSTTDVDLFVPHQANQRITDALAQRLDLSRERVMSTIATTGNSSAATIPHALALAERQGRIGDGAIVLLSGFGAGMTWASAAMRWRRK
ncbi:MAG: beta-ketoacyl-ACP synthase 3 [Microthrixaceae bacterium]|nr:beta-ketoacyl-ACP synthase 3 [Microthrixaceae bacterium]